MPYVRRRTRRRTTRRRPARRTRGRAMVRRRIPRPIPSRVHLFRRVLRSSVTLTTNAVGTLDNSYQTVFSLNGVPNYSEFTALFDHYKMISFNMTYAFTAGNVDNINDVTVFNFPRVLWKPDIDDTGSVSFLQMEQSGRVRSLQLGNRSRTTFSFSVPPYIKVPMQGINTTTAQLTSDAMMPRRAGWLDCANPGIQHGCVKMQLKGTPLKDYVFETYSVYIMAFRDSR